MFHYTRCFIQTITLNKDLTTYREVYVLLMRECLNHPTEKKASEDDAEQKARDNAKVCFEDLFNASEESEGYTVDIEWVE